jgi:plastocyanin
LLHGALLYKTANKQKRDELQQHSMRGRNVMSTKRLGLLTTMLVVLAMGSILFAACTRPGTTPTAGNGGNTSPGENSSGGTTVHMGASNFLVSTITIPKGSKLTLINDVAVPHILLNGTYDANGTPKPSKEPGAPDVNVNFSGSDTHAIGPFTSAGTFKIYCTIHVNMNLTITVK